MVKGITFHNNSGCILIRKQKNMRYLNGVDGGMRQLKNLQLQD